ncbi:MAG TPA: hypothetical protein VK498_08585, partial [Ferruginibacter sp.]|nr:hypothetical protein [Ferruginibacter sp.]
MLLIRKTIFTIIAYCSVPVLLSMNNPGNPINNSDQQINRQDTVPGALPYPIRDRRGDNLSGNYGNIYDLKNPANIKDSVVYDAINRRYILYEKIGDRYYRIPTVYTFDEYWQMRNKQAETEYFQKRANTTSILNRGKLTKPK